MIMSYRNFEAVTIRGLDLSLAYFPADHWRLTGNYSFVNDNFFENLQFSHGEGRGDIALNAPRHKVKLGMDYNFAEWGLALGGPDALHRFLPHEFGGVRGRGGFLYCAGSQPDLPVALGARP